MSIVFKWYLVFLNIFDRIKELISVINITDWFRKSSVLLFVVLSALHLKAQVDSLTRTDLKNKIRSFLNTQPDSALIFIDKGIALGQEKGDSDLLAFSYGTKGAVFANVDPDRAVKFFYKAEVIYKALGNVRNVAASYTNIATYGNLSGDKTLKLLNKALHISIKTGDSILTAAICNNIGKYYMIKDNADSSMFWFDKALNINERINNRGDWFMNLANIAMVEDRLYHRPKSALKTIKRAKDVMPLDRPDLPITLNYGFMGIYLNLGKADSAMYYFHQMKDDDFKKQPGITTDVFRLLSDYYIDQGAFKKGLYYDDKSDSTRDYIHSRNTQNLLSFLEIEHETELRKETVAKLNAKLDRANIIRILMGLVILFTITFIYQQRQKNKRKRELILSRQQQAETELHNSELQRQMLNDELKFTNKELTSFAANIVKNKDHLQQLKDKLDSIIEKKNSRQVWKQLSELRMEILQLFKSDEQRKDFIKRSQQVNHALIFYLKSRYPELSDSDLNLLVLLLLKFSSKEIATLYNIEVNSVSKRRYRLRQKLGLTNREDIEAFFDEIIADFKAVHGKL